MCARSTVSWTSPRGLQRLATPSNTSCCKAAPSFTCGFLSELGSRHPSVLLSCTWHLLIHHRCLLSSEEAPTSFLLPAPSKNSSVLRMYSQPSQATLLSRKPEVETRPRSQRAWKNAE